MELEKNEKAVINLITERLEIGRTRYGGDIPINGEKQRDNLREAIEEAADLSVYVTSLLLEKESHLKKYKKGYYLIMEYWDILPDEDKHELQKKLEKLGL